LVEARPLRKAKTTAVETVAGLLKITINSIEMSVAMTPQHGRNISNG
jgi:hypothetical protein